MTNKLKLFIGNWKMFGDFGSIKIINRIQRFAYKFKYRKQFKIIFCIPNTLISTFSKKFKSKSILIGAQNSHYKKQYGPFTGSVNALMLKRAGAKYVILGHSENRLEGDTNEMIKKKIESALDNKLNIILCIGESLKEKNKGKTFSVLKKQIKVINKKKHNLNKITIAYEPIWSIGTGKIPTVNELKKNFIFIRNQLKNKSKVNKLPKILYGGSVNIENISIFSPISEIDGFLIGGASQSSKNFIDIIKNYYK